MVKSVDSEFEKGLAQMKSEAKAAKPESMYLVWQVRLIGMLIVDEDDVMVADMQAAPVSKSMLWAGWIMSALAALALVMSGVMKFVKPAGFSEGFAHLGYDESLALYLGILELTCTLLYIFPRTSVLGAVLLTGYLGGATASHVRVGDAFFGPIVLGVLVWGGLWLRDVRVRALLPLRS